MKTLKGLLVDPTTHTIRIKRVERNNAVLQDLIGAPVIGVELVRMITPTLALRVAGRSYGNLYQPPLPRWQIDDTIVHGIGFIHGVDMSNGKPHTDGLAIDTPLWVSDAEAAITWLGIEEIVQ